MNLRKFKELEKELKDVDLSALKTDSLPPVPKHIQERLTLIGGKVPNSDKPMFRIISGLDPKIQEFAYGQWHRKYVSVRDVVKTIDAIKAISKARHTSEVMSVKDAQAKGILDSQGNLTKMGESAYNVLFFTSEELIEYGIPRYIVEKFKVPEEFGTPEEWEQARWLSPSDPMNPTNKEIDILGEFPSEGRYDFFCNIEDGMEDVLTGEITSTIFKPLTEEAVNQLADVIAMSRQPALETFQQIIDKAEAKKVKDEAEFDDRIEQGIKENRHRITNMPRVGYGD